jgi:hypothetical protein
VGRYRADEVGSISSGKQIPVAHIDLVWVDLLVGIVALSELPIVAGDHVI